MIGGYLEELISIGWFIVGTLCFINGTLAGPGSYIFETIGVFVCLYAIFSLVVSIKTYRAIRSQTLENLAKEDNKNVKS